MQLITFLVQHVYLQDSFPILLAHRYQDLRDKGRHSHHPNVGQHRGNPWKHPQVNVRIDHGQGNGPASYEDATKTPQTTQIGKQPKTQRKRKKTNWTEMEKINVTKRKTSKLIELKTLKRWSAQTNNGHVSVKVI